MTTLRRARPQPTLLYDPRHAPIHFARRKRRGRGGLRLRPHPAHPSTGSGGLRAAPGVYAQPLLSTSPGPELADYRSFPPGRLRSPVVLCFKCFRRSRLMFQICHLNVANRSWMLNMLQAYVLSVSDVCFKCFHLDVAYVTIALYACFKSMFQVFHMFYTHVESVSSGCCKSRSRCCICCYDYTRMFETYVSSVSDICCKCFIWMFQK